MCSTLFYAYVIVNTLNVVGYVIVNTLNIYLLFNLRSVKDKFGEFKKSGTPEHTIAVYKRPHYDIVVIGKARCLF